MRSHSPASRPARLLYLAALAGLLGACFTTATAAKHRAIDAGVHRVPSILWRDQLEASR